MCWLQDLQAAITTCSCKTSAVRSYTRILCTALSEHFANGRRRTTFVLYASTQHARDLLRWQRVKWTVMCLWWRKQISALLKCEMKYNSVFISCLYLAALFIINVFFFRKLCFFGLLWFDWSICKVVSSHIGLETKETFKLDYWIQLQPHTKNTCRPDKRAENTLPPSKLDRAGENHFTAR